jgi:hypothetical protein
MASTPISAYLNFTGEKYHIVQVLNALAHRQNLRNGFYYLRKPWRLLQQGNNNVTPRDTEHLLQASPEVVKIMNSSQRNHNVELVLAKGKFFRDTMNHSNISQL